MIPFYGSNILKIPIPVYFFQECITEIAMGKTVRAQTKDLIKYNFIP
jgi:hypothetical protein